MCIPYNGVYGVVHLTPREEMNSGYHYPSPTGSITSDMYLEA